MKWFWTNRKEAQKLKKLRESNLYRYAEFELDEFFAHDPEDTEFDDRYNDAVKRDVLELIATFSNQGHSGYSAGYILNIFSKLASWKPITSILNVTEQWNDVTECMDGKTMFQHKKLSSLFKDGENGEPYYLDAITKRLPNGSCWCGPLFMTKKDALEGNVESCITSAAYVKTWPFVPKTFYINVEEYEITKDDFVMYPVNPDQFEEVLQYYDLKLVKPNEPAEIDEDIEQPAE